MSHKIQFDESRARSYCKRLEVLAFRSKDPICFKKSWGEQNIRENGWIIVPLTETGEITQDIYGCDSDVFSSTYEPSTSLRPNQYRKKKTILAYQPGHPFEIETVLSDGYLEVKHSQTKSDDAWIVRAPDGEIYPIENTVFQNTYILAD